MAHVLCIYVHNLNTVIDMTKNNENTSNITAVASEAGNNNNTRCILVQTETEAQTHYRFQSSHVCLLVNLVCCS